MTRFSASIRLANTGDCGGVIDLLREANEASGGYATFPEDQLAGQHFRELIRSNIVLVSDWHGWLTGVLAAQIGATVLDPGTVRASVLSWYVSPSFRGFGDGPALLMELKYIARKRGAKGVSIFLADTPYGGVTIAERLGFKPLERAYYAEV